MNISFECAACESDYEVEIATIIENPAAIKCDNCGAAPAAHRSHALATALEDICAAMAAIRGKVHFVLELETEELPPPWGKPDEHQSEGGLDGGLSFSDEDEDDEEEEEDLEGEFLEEGPEDNEAAKPRRPSFAAFGDFDDEDDDEDFDDFDDDDDDDDDFDDDDFEFDELDDFDDDDEEEDEED